MSLNDNNDENPWNVDKDEPSSEKFDKKSKQPSNKGFSHKTQPGTDDLTKLFENIQKRFRQSNGKGTGTSPHNPLKIFSTVITVLFLLWLGSGFYRVQEGEMSVVLRFGKIARTVMNPGLHYRLPTPIEQAIVRNVVEVHQIESQSSSDHDQNLVLTGDENMVAINYSVQWNIKDITLFLFVWRNSEVTIRAATESALREVVGQTTALLALTEGRKEIGQKVHALLQKILDQYNCGVQIISFNLQRVEPPVQVVEAFNDMQASRVDAARLSNEAEAYRNDILPKARGQAETIIFAAKANAAEIVAKAKGDTARFKSVYTAYKKNPTITRIRLHREMMENLLKQSTVTIVDKDFSNSLQNYHQVIPATVLNKKEGS